MKNILLLDENNDTATQVLFLLKLADFHCTHVISVEEALNCISVSMKTSDGFDLMLIGSEIPSIDGQTLMEQFCCGKTPQLVYQQRQGTRLPEFLVEQVEIIPADSLIPCLRDYVLKLRKEKHEGVQTMPDETSKHPVEIEPSLVTDSMDGRYLTFDLASEGYGLEIRYVTEIIGIQSVTAIPDMPNYMKGVLNLRGKVIPVIDVRLRFQLPERDYDERTCIIVVDVADRSVGLVVDKVSEVIDIPQREIEPAPMSKSQQQRSYISGMGKLGEQVKILLDIEQLLEDEVITDQNFESEVV